MGAVAFEARGVWRVTYCNSLLLAFVV